MATAPKKKGPVPPGMSDAYRQKYLKDRVGTSRTSGEQVNPSNTVRVVYRFKPPSPGAKSVKSRPPAGRTVTGGQTAYQKRKK
jgi:hypothetical protein